MNLRFERLFSLLSTGTLLLVSLAGHAAGFDCAKATSVTEKAICADKELSALDSELAFVWQKISGFDPAAMKSSQLQWLKLRDACGADASCLRSRYNERLDVLHNMQFPVGADQAGNRLEALIAESTDADARRCTADKQFCVRILRDESYDSTPLIQIDYAGANPATYDFTLPDPRRDDETPWWPRVSAVLWPRVLRLAGDQSTILVGAGYSEQWGYSGGGGSALELRLFRVSRKGDTFRAREVLSVPIEGSLMIRACFSGESKQEAARYLFGACHDLYDFNATLGLDRTVKSGFPRLVYQTRATSFPGKVSRNKDSLAMPPLRKRDVVTVVDPHCTYKRTFQLKKITGVYVPDKPLPDCGNYLDP